MLGTEGCEILGAGDNGWCLVLVCGAVKVIMCENSIDFFWFHRRGAAMVMAGDLPE